MHETSFTVVSRPRRPSQAMTANRDPCMYMLLPVSHAHHDNEYMVTCTDSHVHRQSRAQTVTCTDTAYTIT